MLQLSDTDHELLEGYTRELLEKLETLLARVDTSRLTPDSGFKVHRGRRRTALELGLVPREYPAATLHLWADEQSCTLGFGDGEILECNHSAEQDPTLVGEVLTRVERLLRGVTAIEYTSRRGKLCQRDWYWGAGEEFDPEARIGRARFGLIPRRGEESRRAEVSLLA